MATGNIPNWGNVVSADWKVTSVNSTLHKQMTNTLTFPEIGTWLLIMKVPYVQSGIMLSMFVMNGLSMVKSDYNVFNIQNSYESYILPVEVTSANATAYLESASSFDSITFDMIARGGLMGVKIK